MIHMLLENCIKVMWLVRFKQFVGFHRDNFGPRLSAFRADKSQLKDIKKEKFIVYSFRNLKKIAEKYFYLQKHQI